MAIACSEPVAEINSNVDASTYSWSAFTPASNATLVALVFAAGTTVASPTISGGLSWTLKTSVLYNSVNTAYLFWANTGSSPGSLTFTFDCTGDAATGCIGFMFEYTGSDVTTADPIRQYKTASGTGSANPAATYDSAADTNNGVGGGFGCSRNPPTSTPPGSWTEIGDVGHTSPTHGATAAYRAGGETGTTMTFTSASTNWGAIIFEVYVSGAGPTGGSNPHKALNLLGVG